MIPILLIIIALLYIYLMDMTYLFDKFSAFADGGEIEEKKEQNIAY